MAVGPSPQWLAASIRLLQKQVDSLGARLQVEPRRVSQIRLDELIPPCMLAPPGVHVASSKLLSAEVFDNEDVSSADNFLQINNVSYHSKQLPRSPQFIAPDEARDPMDPQAADVFNNEDVPSLDTILQISHDNEQDATDDDAAGSKFLVEKVFSSEDVPSPDTSSHMPRNDVHDGEQYQHGDVDMHVIDAASSSSDFSSQQFAPDEARDPMSSAEARDCSEMCFDYFLFPDTPYAKDADTFDFFPHKFIAPKDAYGPIGDDDAAKSNVQDATDNDAAKSEVLATEVFNNEDVPSLENILQISHDNEQDAANDDAAGATILFEKVFNSEDVPSPGTSPHPHMPRNDVHDGEQYEYGDMDTHATGAASSDFSPHQLAPDEARDPMSSADTEQDAANNNAANHMPHDDDGEQYEHGEVEAHAIDAASSDFSPHQFAPDEARDHGSPATCMPHDNITSPKTLDPLHVHAMIEIAKKMSEEITNACVTEVATKLLKCMNDKMSVFEEKIKELEENVAMTRHIQHATFSRKFGVDY